MWMSWFTDTSLLNLSAYQDIDFCCYQTTRLHVKCPVIRACACTEITGHFFLRVRSPKNWHNSNAMLEMMTHAQMLTGIALNIYISCMIQNEFLNSTKWIQIICRYGLGADNSEGCAFLCPCFEPLVFTWRSDCITKLQDEYTGWRPLNSTQKCAWQVFLVMPIKFVALAH